MSSGAYSIFIDQQAGGGPTGAALCGEWYPSHLRSFPGPSSSVRLFFRSHMTTLAGAPPTIPATVRVLRGSGTVDTLNVTIEVGRKWFHFFMRMIRRHRPVKSARRFSSPGDCIGGVHDAVVVKKQIHTCVVRCGPVPDLINECLGSRAPTNGSLNCQRQKRC